MEETEQDGSPTKLWKQLLDDRPPTRAPKDLVLKENGGEFKSIVRRSLREHVIKKQRLSEVARALTRY